MTVQYTIQQLKKMLETAKSPEQRAAIEESIRSIKQLGG